MNTEARFIDTRERRLRDLATTIPDEVAAAMIAAADLIAQQAETVSKLSAFDRLVSDMDRCEHGRHEGDICSGCDNGPSVGGPNPTGTTVGHTIDGTPYVVPPRGERHRPEHWLPADAAEVSR